MCFNIKQLDQWTTHPTLSPPDFGITHLGNGINSSAKLEILAKCSDDIPIYTHEISWTINSYSIKIREHPLISHSIPFKSHWNPSKKYHSSLPVNMPINPIPINHYISYISQQKLTDAGMIIDSSPVNHSRKFPAFSTSKKTITINIPIIPYPLISMNH